MWTIIEKLIKNPWTIILLLVGLLVVLVARLDSVEKQRDLYHNNQTVLLDSVRKYKVADSLNAAQVKQLVLTNKEFKQNFRELYDLVGELKTGKVESVHQVTKTTETQIKTIIRDSVAVRDSVVIRGKGFTYADNWTDMKGFIYEDTVDVKYKNHEALALAISYVKKRFLGIKLPIWLFGYKTMQVDAVSNNPNTTIDDVTYITIK